MPRRVNAPQNKEQLQMMVEAVQEEVKLAQDLLNSYEKDLANLEANTIILEKNKASRRVFLETAIKESKDLLNLRQKQLKAIDPTKSGKNVNEARKNVWNDTTIESKGMNAIMEERARAAKDEKHTQDVARTQAERQARSEAIRNAAATLATAANKLADEKQEESTRPDFIEGSNNWVLGSKSNNGNVYKYIDPNNQSISYLYFPQINEVIKSEKIGQRLLNTVYNTKTNEWNQVPKEVYETPNMHFNADKGQWMKYDFENKQWEGNELEESDWQVPVYDENGKLVLDPNGKLVLNNRTDSEILNQKTDAEKARMARQIEQSILGEEADNPNPQKEEKVIYRKDGHLNWFQRLKQWFMRLFNKNYQLPSARESGYYLSGEGENQKLVYKANSKSKDIDKDVEKYIYRAENSKKTIKGYYIPKVKQLFKDNKKRIMALSAFAVATIGMAMGINGLKRHNREIIEQRAAEAQRQEDINREHEEKMALAQAEKEQRQQEAMENLNRDKLINHDPQTLTTGSINKQYIAPAGLEYTEDSTGRGAKGTISKDTIVEIYNRAIVRENDDGTKQILLSTGGKTWEDYAKDTGMSIEDIQNLLKQDKTHEEVAIKLPNVDGIQGVFGWEENSNLKESSKGTENLKDFEISTGDNTEILQQLQQQEQVDQEQEER